MIVGPVVGIEVSQVRPGEPVWAIDVIKHLDDGELPGKKGEARKVNNMVTRFTLLDGVLYRWGFSIPLLTRVSLEEA